MTAGKIAELVKGTVCGDPERTITGISGIKDAAADQLSFVGNKKYEDQLGTSAAGIVLVCKDLANASTENRTLIVCDNVDVAFAKLSAMYADEPPVYPVGIHPSAVVNPSAKMFPSVPMPWWKPEPKSATEPLSVLCAISGMMQKSARQHCFTQM